MEWRREDEKLNEGDKGRAVEDLIELVVAIDGILQGQAAADADYFLRSIARELEPSESETVRHKLLEAYRWPYIVSGVEDGRFLGVMTELLTEKQLTRVTTALAPLPAARA